MATWDNWDIYVQRSDGVSERGGQSAERFLEGVVRGILLSTDIPTVAVIVAVGPGGRQRRWWTSQYSQTVLEA
jgi:hypothetical protein